MALVDVLDKGASLGGDQLCLVSPAGGPGGAAEVALTYDDVVAHSHAVAAALHRDGVRAGDAVAVLSGNDPVAFATVFGISRAGALWCPVNPRAVADENRELLALFGARALVFAAAHAPVVAQIAPQLPELTVLVCLDADLDAAGGGGSSAGGLRAPSLDRWLAGAEATPAPPASTHRDDGPVMIVGTGGTTGRPKGVVLTDRNLETMTAVVLMSYPFDGRPAFLALAPLTHAAGVLCLPVLALGGRIVVMRAPDVGGFLRLIGEQRITHTFLPPTVIYSALDHPEVAQADVSSLQCFWYGAAPMSVTRLEQALTVFGPVMGQLFGQTEAPMMISTLSPAEHFRADGSVALERLASAGRPSPLVTVAVVDGEGRVLPAGERGEVVVRGSLVMAGYHRDPEATAAASAHGWHHTGDIGYLDEDGYLFIVDRAKDMIISGGFNVYSAEVEQALMSHPAVREAAVVGVPDDHWGERVVAVVTLHETGGATEDELIAHARARVGSVKAPKQVHLRADLPRSRVGKILKAELRTGLRAAVRQPSA